MVHVVCARTVRRMLFCEDLYMDPSPVSFPNFDRGSEVIHITCTISARLCRCSVISHLLRV